MKQFLLLLNPEAGGGRARKLQTGIVEEFARHGFEPTVYCSTGPGSIRRWLAEASLAGMDGAVACGGDGTLFETLNGLMAHDHGQRPPLGVLPIGTGNAFSRDLGLAAGDWQTAIERMSLNQVRAVDVGQLDCSEGRYHFLNIAGMGFVVSTGATASRLKGIGKSAYTLAALWQTLKLPSQQVVIQHDGQRLERHALFVEISNSRYTGTSFLMAPRALLDDGLLDLTVVQSLSRLRLLRLFRTIYSGQHVDYPEVTTLQSREFEIREPAGCPLMIDGEFVGITPAVIRCLPRELLVFC